MRPNLSLKRRERKIVAVTELAKTAIVMGGSNQASKRVDVEIAGRADGHYDDVNALKLACIFLCPLTSPLSLNPKALYGLG